MASTSETFSPIRPNPYIVGNPVRDRAMFFGREAEFELVRKRFEHSTRGGLLVFCGERRSGKTSILFQILDQRLGQDFIPVLIDMQSMATGSEAEFLSRISAEIRGAIGPGPETPALPSFVPGTSHSATFQAFIQDVLRARPGRKLILLFDEYELFENKIDSGTLDQDVLYILASLMEQHSVFLIFTGSQHLEERRREYWNILGKSIFKTISYLEHDDAVKLVTQPVAGRVRWEDGVVEAIIRLAAGQPFYTQAICQSLVDHLNERRSRVASLESVAAVVAALVDNPLPQMIFLWDGLERDEKLTLALLAEAVADDRAHTTADDLRRTARQYPLDLAPAQIASALEKLFKTEMVLRSDATSPPGYAFRMDLWRLWIRRQHSVWQVMREAGLEIRAGSAARRRRRRLVLAAAAAGLVIAIPLGLSRLAPGRLPGSGPLSATASAPLALHATPENAVIHLDGQRIGIGSFQDALAAGREHRFRLTAQGYADTEITVRLDAGVPAASRIAMRALLGDLRIETRPAGAEVTVDGRRIGRSPVVARGLAVAEPHRVSASLAGFGAAAGEFVVAAGITTPALLALEVGRSDVLVLTHPAGAEILVDGVARGRTPLRLEGLTLGRHRLSAQRAGHVSADTTLVVAEGTREIELALVPLPPGELVVQGDVPATIYIDGRLVVENVQNSGARELEAGEHAVRVVLLDNQTVDYQVEVRARERVTYDFSRNTVSRRPRGTP